MLVSRKVLERDQIRSYLGTQVPWVGTYLVTYAIQEERTLTLSAWKFNPGACAFISSGMQKIQTPSKYINIAQNTDLNQFQDSVQEDVNLETAMLAKKKLAC